MQTGKIYRDWRRKRIITLEAVMLSLILFALFVGFPALLSAPAAAFPPIATEFYGTAEIGGENASIGSEVDVYTKEGVLCGRFLIKHEGRYGFLSCKGDDPDTPGTEGGKPGEEIIFKVNGINAESKGDTHWGEGSFRNVNLSVSIDNIGKNTGNDQLNLSVYSALPGKTGLILLALISTLTIASIYTAQRTFKSLEAEVFQDTRKKESETKTIKNMQKEVNDAED